MLTKKICLLGDFAIGKTSLTTRFVRQTYSDKYLTTVGVKIDSKLVKSAGQETVKLVIWDIAGTDADEIIVDENYLRGSAGVFLVADGCRKNTLGSVMKLRSIVSDLVGECPMIVAINKVDLFSEWEVGDVDIAGLQDDGLQVFKTSAKTGENVETAFQHLTRLLIST